MRTIIVSCVNVCTNAQLVDRVARMLDLPSYCGKNLDALADCLWEVRTPLHVIFAGLDDNTSVDPDYARRLKLVFSQAAEDIEGLTFAAL